MKLDTHGENKGLVSKKCSFEQTLAKVKQQLAKTEADKLAGLRKLDNRLIESSNNLLSLREAITRMPTFRQVHCEFP